MKGYSQAIRRPAAGIGRAFGAFALASACLLLAAPAVAQGRHGLSAFGDLKYPADFQHFDYVNPDAPKGGRLSMIGTAGRTTFDSFNNFILKGDAAQGLEYLFDSLMTRHGGRRRVRPDRGASSARRHVRVFRLRPEAKFADGSPGDGRRRRLPSTR
jgi:microcin C transport system substrate-binding protein